MHLRLLTLIRRFRYPLIVVLFSLPTVISLLRPGIFPMHDDMQMMRVNQLYKCLTSLQIPCRWVPDMGYGYGYPQFHYYGPLPYYLAAFSHFFGLTYIGSVKFIFIAALILGNLSMYFLGRRLWGTYGGLFSALLYAYAPYRAGDIFSRGAMGETWGFVFMPLILMALIRLLNRPGLKSAALFALAVAGLMLSHNITTLVFAPLALLFALAYIIAHRLNLKKILPWGIIAALWAVAVAATFTLPVIFETRYAHVETMLMGYFNYLAHFVTIKQLFFTTFWAYGSSELGPNDDLSFFVGPLHLLTALVVLSLAFIDTLRHFKSSRRLPPAPLLVFTMALVFLIAVFFTHSKSGFIWQRLSLLHYLQFPWRFLSPAAFFISLLGGYYFTRLPRHPLFVFIPLSLLLILTNAAFFHPKSWTDITDREKFSGYLYDRQLTISIYDYLPVFASHPPVTVAPTYPTVVSGTADVYRYNKQSDSITFSVRAETDTRLLANLFDFPGMKVTANGKIIPHHHDNELGLVAFSLPAGDHRVTVALTDTPVRTLGNLLTLLSLSAVLLVIFKKHD